MQELIERLTAIEEELKVLPKATYGTSGNLGFIKWSLYAQRRRIRMKMARAKGTHTREEWGSLLKSIGHCVICRRTDDLTKDHIVSVARGGSDGIENLQPLCGACNARKGAR